MNIVDIFGQIQPPPGSAWAINPIAAIGTLIIFIIKMFLLIAGLAAFFYMLWGAFDWITSSGNPEKISQARAKMTNAVLGLLLTIAALSIFILLTTDVLKIIRLGRDGEWLFNIPTINQCIKPDLACDPLGTNKCCTGSCISGVCK